MFVWLALLFYDFCGFRSVVVNRVYKLQLFKLIIIMAAEGKAVIFYRCNL